MRAFNFYAVGQRNGLGFSLILLSRHEQIHPNRVNFTN
ncbi:hypothetical protein GPUN_1491 [Glaciecola punicea ACAM 611]|uniref:Uncharacterized protein n=1 Tax=Glaciecola punicea ACAM 611 TaxID=1121923 RepID=H5TBD4_9ALTE|nr:hypothetical protein GPUN_1491 [Glaciecola punicea ACAM 611]